jgi:antitoxin component of MazEF toxin-antitoxin module
MKRKVIRQRDSFTVTLPKKWVDAKNLQQGDEVNIDVESGKVVIDSEAKPGMRAAEIDVEKKEMLRSVIGVLYRAGYNKAAINTKQEVSLADLQKALQFFTGLEVEEYGKKRIILRCITPVSSEEYDFFVRKTFLSIKVMLDEMISFADNGKFSFSNIEEMRKNNLKAREYCMRAINVTRPGRKNICDEYAFIHILEKISGDLWYMGRYINRNKTRKSPKLKPLLKLLHDNVDRSYKTYLKKDYRLGFEVLGDRFAMRKEYLDNDKLKRLFKEDVDPVVLALCLSIRDKISSAMARYLSAIVEDVQATP